MKIEFNTISLVIIALLTWSCSKSNQVELPIELNDVPQSEIEVTEHLFYPDTSQTEREDIYYYQTLFDLKNNAPSSHKWTINKFDENDSLIETSVFHESEDQLAIHINYSYNPYQNYTKYILNKKGDTSQIEKVNGGKYGILTKEVINKWDKSTSSFRYFYVDNLLDSMLIIITNEEEEIIDYAEKHYYSNQSDKKFVVFNYPRKNQLGYVPDTILFNRNQLNRVYTIELPSGDTIGVDILKSEKIIETTYVNLFGTYNQIYNNKGQVIKSTSYLQDNDTTVEFIHYDKKRTLKFKYTK